MSDDLSPVLALPLLQPAQAQKHVTHNEALRLLDVLVQPAALSRTTATPPAAPAEGARYIVPPGAGGAWSGHDGALTFAEAGAWVFMTPQPGWQAHIADEAAVAVFDGSLWVTPAERPQRYGRLGIGTDADAVNRLAVAAPATLLSHDGAGHQLKLNKAGAAETASLLFQTGWSGRAEMGTAGSDDFAIKVSADGSAWQVAAEFARASGAASLPGGLRLAAGTPAAPGLAFIGDTDTGICRSAANQLTLATGGAARAVLGDAGLTLNVPLGGAAVAPVSDALPGLGTLLPAGMGNGLVNKGRILPGEDLNDGKFCEPGIWRINSGADTAATLNTPAGAASCSVLEVLSPDQIRARGALSLIIQRFTARYFGGSPRNYPRTWMRQNNSTASGGWGPWVELVTLTEEGSNANGAYRRWSDGRQECVKELSFSSVSTVWGSLFMSDALGVIPHAAVFTGNPTFSVHVADSLACMVAQSATTIRLVRAASSASPAVAVVTSSGRWF